ncbi:MAG: hypothetical protein DME37_05330 [Verrucomicrobia bacterium]|nr:MAG: hypothetical protein DME37_05330 [Verrucomicrobiota bacterium]
MLFYVLFIGRIAKRCFHFFPALRRKKFAKKQRDESIDGTNAVVVANVREGKNELIPRFFPLTFTNVPTRIMMVFEDGTWKLDLIKPTPEVAKVLEAREVAITLSGGTRSRRTETARNHLQSLHEFSSGCALEIRPRTGWRKNKR